MEPWTSRGGQHSSAQSSPGHPAIGCIIAGVVLYLAVLAVTAGIHIPLNNTLDAAGPVERIADLSAVRAHFETAWVRWNIVRTVLCTGSFGCLVWALPHA